MKGTLLRNAVICMGSVLAISVMAQSDPTTQTTPQTGSSTTGTTGQQLNDLRASKAIGAEVKSQTGEKLGKISDLILNSSNGRVDFAVIDWNNKLVPVPFTLLNASMTQGRTGFFSPTGQELSFTANVSTDKLQNAPTIDKSKWTEIHEQGWSQRVYSYYGVSSQNMGAPGQDLGTPGQGTGSSSGMDQNMQPQSSTPDLNQPQGQQSNPTIK